MTEEKTYVFGNEGGGIASMLAPLMSSVSSLPALMSSMGGMNGMNGNGWWVIIILLALWGRNGFGGNGDGNTDAILSALNNDTGRDMLLSAINNNGNAISQLATTLNCDVNQLNQAICTVNSSLERVSGQIGFSTEALKNAITAGDASLASQMAQCCCDIRTAITTQGYENRIATLEQTNTLAGKIDAQTTLINDKFCQLEMREMQNKLDALREERSTLIGQLSQEHQTANIQAYIASLVNPIATEVTAIKAAQPPTVSVPYPQLAAVPAPVGFAYGLNSIYNNTGLFGFNNNGSIWA